MRNRRLTIFPLAMILMTACAGDSTSTEPEMLAMIGTWQVATWVITQTAAPNTVVNPFAVPSSGDADNTYPLPLSTDDAITDATLYFYENSGNVLGTLLSIVNVPDTAKTNQSVLPDSIFLDASEYLIGDWCVLTAFDDDVICVEAAADEIVIDEGGSAQQIWQFVRNGDSMTLNAIAGAEYDFGFAAEEEPATWTMTLNRVIIDYNRPDIQDRR